VESAQLVELQRDHDDDDDDDEVPGEAGVSGGNMISDRSVSHCTEPSKRRALTSAQYNESE